MPSLQPVPTPKAEADKSCPEPMDPWDPESFKFTADEFAQSEIRSRKVLTKVRVQQPDGKTWFMVHPKIKLKAALFYRETEEQVQPETYLVRQDVVPLFG